MGQKTFAELTAYPRSGLVGSTIHSLELVSYSQAEGMESAARYWQLVRLDSSGQRRIEKLAIAESFFLDQFGRGELSDSELHLALLQKLTEPSSRDAADLCLRCYISHQIEQVCVRLEQQFGRQHGFTRYDLLPLVLHDRGIPRSQQPNNPWQPLAWAIIDSFMPQQASLNTWVMRQVRHHKDLNEFLLERGVYLITDWALLNDTNPAQLQRILSEFYGTTTREAEQAGQLLQAYHTIYRGDRIKQRLAGVLKARQTCLPPQPEQLQRIATYLGETTPTSLANQRLMAKLQILASQLRQYRIHVRSKRVPTISIDQPEIEAVVQAQTTLPEGNADEQQVFLEAYRAQLQVCLAETIQQVTQDRVAYLKRRQPQTADQFLRALYLFHCQGKAMAEIATLLGLQAQYQVTRLIKLKQFRADVQQRLLKQLGDRITQIAQQFTTSEQLQTLNQAIAAALEEQISTLMQQAEAEAMVARQRPLGSLFARQLCHHLDTLHL